ncbi:polyphosphate kinase 1 [Clostridium sp.]|uniref:polyphosphate kinase 1 n=1 Tax=Clostridium sp. TaxID=1506 RepID=UPI003077D3C3
MNRELSWLKFNDRVLEEAADEENPLCERLSFLSIFQTNLDEFFMVRVGSLHDMQFLKKEVRDNKTGMTPQEQIEAILQTTALMARRKDQVYMDLMGLLTDQGIRVVSFSALNDIEKKQLERYFEQEIKPLLSTIIVGKKQPFPFLQNREIYAVAVRETRSETAKIGLSPGASRVVDRMVPVPARSGYYMLAEELILHFLPMVFDKYRVQEKSLIRITRNADIDADSIYDEDLNYREHMEEVVRQRRKLSPVRLEMTRTLDTGIIDRLCRVLELSENQVFMSQSPLDLSFVFQIQDTLRTHSELFYPRRIPQNSPAIQKDRPVLDQVLEKDLLLSYPFESIKPFLRMLHEAAADPTVVSIKMTLYRLAKDSKVVEALVEAAENGKQVDVLVELKARFDEENNIAWSRMLEDAGCHVIYGLDGYKVHSKLCLITRKSGTRIEYITQIGTGNYNEKTSRLYTDLSLITSNSEIGLEAFEVFQALSLGETVEQTDVLFVAPNCLQNKVLDRIDREIKLTKEGKKGYLGFKLNSLTDKRIIDKLIEASQAGVQIDMVVRGICCLQPGIPGYTDHIRIISIVGRYLEHSRIYIFGTGDREEIYISSADFMTRNTLRRVEVSVPIFNSKLREELKEMFGLMLSDNVKARELGADGTYRKVSTGDTQLNSQEVLFQIAYDCAQTGKGEA